MPLYPPGYILAAIHAGQLHTRFPESQAGKARPTEVAGPFLNRAATPSTLLVPEESQV